MKTLNVVAAIIERDSQLLATQRGYGELKGGWEFPGGKIEAGETHEEALSREIMEELNISIHIKRFLVTISYDYPEFHLHMHCYLCKIEDGEITLFEHSDARWLSINELESLNWLPADLEAIPYIKANIS